ncbi:hypothetical protein [Terriglobus sp. ADX1]|uniref:hypothetical protein n=1 Tax=Terriglobus sp. ADX1 TaxID=2794063 RepID=UPI002FE54D71
MANLSYEERSLYGVLVVNLAVYLPYLFLSRYSNSLTRIAGAMVLLMALQILSQAVIAVATRNRLQDERDKQIRLYGYRAGYIAFTGLVGTGLSLLWLWAAYGHLDPMRLAIQFLSVLFGTIVLADIARVVTQLIAHRRPV